MEVNTRTQTESRRVVEVNGYEFYVEDIAGPLGWLRRGSVKDELVDSAVLRRMEEAGLVRRKQSGQWSMDPDTETITEWEQVDGKCRELFDQLNEPYCRLRPKVGTISHNEFGMFDELEDTNARERAERVVAELNERNPDVPFELAEEELNHIPTRE